MVSLSLSLLPPGEECHMSLTLESDDYAEVSANEAQNGGSLNTLMIFIIFA